MLSVEFNTIMLNVIMPSVAFKSIMLSVVMLSVVMHRVMAPNELMALGQRKCLTAINDPYYVPFIF
jgi:hypothetical protein